MQHKINSNKLALYGKRLDKRLPGKNWDIAMKEERIRYGNCPNWNLGRQNFLLQNHDILASADFAKNIFS